MSAPGAGPGTSPQPRLSRPGPSRCACAGSPGRPRRLPAAILYAAGLVSPLLRELRETRYQFDRPFVMDSSAFENTFGLTATPTDAALDATIAAARTA